MILLKITQTSYLTGGEVQTQEYKVAAKWKMSSEYP